jgi:hypothetical protein
MSKNPATSSSADLQKSNFQEYPEAQAAGIIGFRRVGVDADFVGTWDNGSPDGNLDGISFLT